MAKEKKTKRELILDAAFDLILDKGYRDTKIIDIAEAAGIGKGTVYEYFASKDALFYELFKSKVANSYMDISHIINEDLSCEDKIRKYVAFELSTITKFPFSKNILLDLFMQSDAFNNTDLVNAIHKLIGYKFSIIYQIMEEGIQKGELQKIDPLMAATSVLGSINFFLSFNNNLIDSEIFLPVEKTQPWDKEEFLKLIFKGLKG